MELTDKEVQEQRLRNLEVIQSGWTSDYWLLIRDYVRDWIKDEEMYLDSFKFKGMNPSAIEEYNRCRDRIKFMRTFLDINQILVEENQTFIDRAKTYAERMIKRAQSFVQR